MDIQYYTPRQYNDDDEDDDDDTSKKILWYSDQDYKAMKIANRHAVVNVHRRFQKKNTHNNITEEVGKEDDLDCILTGLERLLTPKIIKKSQSNRIQAWNAVLNEQQRQRTKYSNDRSESDIDNDNGVEELARVCRLKSEWASTRAHTIGMLNAPPPK